VVPPGYCESDGKSATVPDECPNDEDVTEDDYAEWQCTDGGESNPRPHIHLEVAVLGGRPATDQLEDQLRRAVSARPDLELRTSSPEHVQVLADSCQHGGGGEVLGAPRLTGRRATLERETDGDEAIHREDDADPDGTVAARVERELLQLTQHCVRLLTGRYNKNNMCILQGVQSK